VALCRPERKVVILDGDGNVLMAMGTLAMIASNAPKNLTHVVIDNQVYESTGKQRSLSKEIDLAEVARGTGYKMVLKVTQKDQLKSAFEQLINSEGPSFLLIKVEPSFSSTTGRVTHTPEEIRDRFMESVA
jgi:thiamine pyrophosphate-dependent acetolactate synthase large subunit-like protein